MNERDEVYCFVSPELQEFLADNEIELREIWEKADPSIRVTYKPDPTTKGAKEVATMSNRIQC